MASNSTIVTFRGFSAVRAIAHSPPTTRLSIARCAEKRKRGSRAQNRSLPRTEAWRASRELSALKLARRNVRPSIPVARTTHAPLSHPPADRPARRSASRETPRAGDAARAGGHAGSARRGGACRLAVSQSQRRRERSGLDLSRSTAPTRTRRSSRPISRPKRNRRIRCSSRSSTTPRGKRSAIRL